MKIRLTILSPLLLLLASCGPSDEIPADILSPDSMKVIVWDMALADQIALQNHPMNRDSQRITATILYQRVLANHKLTKEQFYKNYGYYEAHPDKLNALFDSLGTYGLRKKTDTYKHGL